jgi:hypothetical protein
MEVGLELNAEKMLFMPRRQNVGQDHNLTIVNTLFENVRKSICLGKTGTKIALKLTADRIWGMLATIQFRIFCLPFSALKANINMHKAIILPGRETWSLTLREEHRLRVFENRVLRRILGPKAGKDCIMRSLVTYTHHQILLGC